MKKMQVFYGILKWFSFTSEYFPKVLKWLIEALFIVVGRVLLTGTFCWFIPLCSLHIDILSIHTHRQPPPVLKTDQQFNMQQFLYTGFYYLWL